MIRVLIAIVALLFSLLVLSAYAQTPESLDAVTKSGICPADLQIYHDLDYSSCKSINSTIKRVHCQDHIDALNHKISKYNDFIRTCREMGKSKSDATSPSNSSPWKNRLQQARQRNEQLSDRQRHSQRDYDAAIEQRRQETQRLWEEGARQYEAKQRQRQREAARANKARRQQQATTRSSRAVSPAPAAPRRSKLTCPGPNAAMREPRCWSEQECACPYWTDKNRTEPYCRFKGTC